MYKLRFTGTIYPAAIKTSIDNHPTINWQSENTTAIAPQQPDLAVLSTAVAKPEDFDKVLRMVLTEPPLFMVLRDLIDAITQWHRVPINTARVLDGLRHLLSPGEEPKRGWEKLRAALRVEESYLRFVTDQSAPPRHGDPAHIPGTITSEVAARAWIVLNRYLEYRKRDSQTTAFIGVSDFALRVACPEESVTMADQQQKCDYLDEHIPYMLKMLRYTDAQMLQAQDYLSWNAHFESFAVHARNLVNFLANKDTGNVKAHEFVRNFKARTSDIGGLMRKLDQQVFHLAKVRPRGVVGKFNSEHVKPVRGWV